MSKTVTKKKTKACPFCAETILAAAVKCRFCSEFLYPEGHPALENLHPDEEYEEDEYDEEDFEDEDDVEEEPDDEVLFRVKPSVLALVGAFIKTLIVMAVAVVVYRVPIEEHIQNYAVDRFTFSENHYIMFESYRILASAAIGVLAVLIFAFKIIILKSTAYEVTPDRIEWERGIFNRKIDNIDMFRVVDMKLHRSIFDCMTGIGTVTLYTKDETDPEFELYKVRKPRKIYDILKKVSLAADNKQGVIHLE